MLEVIYCLLTCLYVLVTVFVLKLCKWSYCFVLFCFVRQCNRSQLVFVKCKIKSKVMRRPSVFSVMVLVSLSLTEGERCGCPLLPNSCDGPNANFPHGGLLNLNLTPNTNLCTAVWKYTARHLSDHPCIVWLCADSRQLDLNRYFYDVICAAICTVNTKQMLNLALIAPLPPEVVFFSRAQYKMAFRLGRKPALNY